MLIFDIFYILYKVVIGFQVTWRKVGDLYPMTIGLSTFVSDSRITVSYDERLCEWRLLINDVQRTDDGVYKCQVNTKDDKSNFYSFYVQVKSMSINPSTLSVSEILDLNISWSRPILSAAYWAISSPTVFWLCNVVKRGICYENICLSVCLSATLVSHA